MTTPPLSLTWSIFEEPPDDMDARTGALLINWNGSTGRDIYDMARAYRYCYIPASGCSVRQQRVLGEH